jgi:hypothetical protein
MPHPAPGLDGWAKDAHYRHRERLCPATSDGMFRNADATDARAHTVMSTIARSASGIRRSLTGAHV